MKEGDRVIHKKYGRGTVKRIYSKNDSARVVYDNGHDTVNAQKRLEKILELTEEQRQVVTPSKVTRSRAAGSAKVDYSLLERCKKHLEKMFPDCAHVIPRISGSKVYGEVWQLDGTAKIWFYEETGKRGKK